MTHKTITGVFAAAKKRADETTYTPPFRSDLLRDGEGITFHELVEFMQANDVPFGASIVYSDCGSHDFDLEWDDESPADAVLEQPAPAPQTEDVLIRLGVYATTLMSAEAGSSDPEDDVETATRDGIAWGKRVAGRGLAEILNVEQQILKDGPVDHG